MHIPDGYLGPKTFLTCYALAAPFWWRAWAGLRSRMQSLEVPHVALTSAFVFVIMMFNVPLPGGTSGHAVGAAAAAIALGAWPAVLAVSFALLVQCLLFGDGGITAYGANCLNMAVIEPLVALIVWRVIRPADLRARAGRTFWAAFAAGYIGIVAAAFATSVEFGIQPLLEHTRDGTPLYSPYPLSVAVPAMVLSHLVVGILEGAVTGFLVVALAKNPETVITSSSNLVPAPTLWKRRSFWIAGAAIVLLVPIGLWLPRLLGAGNAWGEWSPEDAAHGAKVAHVPTGMHRLSDLWRAPVSDYAFHATENHTYESVQYVFAAVLGVAAIALLFSLLGKWQKARLRALTASSGSETMPDDG